MAPRRPQTADGSRKAQPSLDAPEPDFAAMLEQFCNLRRRVFSQTEIQTKLQLKRHQPSLLLAEAARRRMTGSQENQSDAVAEWPLTMFAAIWRMSTLTERGIKQRLKRALDAAIGNPQYGLIIAGPDGTTQPHILARPQRTPQALSNGRCISGRLRPAKSPSPVPPENPPLAGRWTNSLPNSSTNTADQTTTGTRNGPDTCVNEYMP